MNPLELAQLRFERAQVAAQMPTDEEFQEFTEAWLSMQQAGRAQQIAHLRELDARIQRLTQRPHE